MTTTPSGTRITQALSTEHCLRLMSAARAVTLPQGQRLFDEGGRADWFWVVRTGTVALDMHVPGRRSPVIEVVGSDELVGWSWLFPPHRWQLGASAASEVRAYEFDATAVRIMCARDPKLATDVARWVGRVLARRLQAARTRLLDLYAPYGSGGSW
ncbi:hypothetical protein GCM10018785_05610 [Streptomyces longispororuber]|uniref:Cyclic nucleotide-binding domain-containing protein n=1 Tax=Streptomyces longispororuber TaxID=68230 RepID=A0A918Z7A1_9ACTN|nr:cyclic nucleotide-binding domain-containing protein [Streptomyces longispororuber]GHE38937.1 hypothetical protein GCM10018785_05610 [Streptomyces longispororuber]